MLCVRAVAFLELLAGAARAWIVAANLFSGDTRGVAVGCGGGSDGASHIELALFLALELALERVDGGRGRAGRDGNGRVLFVCRFDRRLRGSRWSERWRLAGWDRG